jgi:predicted glutamine amidotransferase
MCRFTLYQGPPLRISALVTEPRNSLIHQSFNASEREEPLNGDGFGLAWYAPTLTPRPGLFRSVTPAWNNANLLRLADVVESPCILAHVRAATQVRSVGEVNCHPFTSGRYALMHNGDLGGFLALRRALLAQLSDGPFDAIQGLTDSEHLFALFLERLVRDGEPDDAQSLGDRVRGTIEDALALVDRHAAGSASYLNLAVTNGRESVATRFTTEPDDEGESLYLHRGRLYRCEDGVCHMVSPATGSGAVLVSSEALSDDPGWEPIPRNHMVTIDAAGGCTLSTI